MNTRIFDAFQTRQQQVSDYMAGCGQKYGMPCTCGPDCRCANCPEHCKNSRPQQQQQSQQQDSSMMDNGVGDTLQPMPLSQGMMGAPPGPNALDNNFMPPVPEKEHMDVTVSRNPSIISFGGNMRHMSLTSTSEATFGRAMSGLSALSIDWENMEDFDVNVDHSAHIVNGGPSVPGAPQDSTPSSFMGNSGGRRTSLRRSINTMNTDDSHSAQVSFKV